MAIQFQCPILLLQKLSECILVANIYLFYQQSFKDFFLFVVFVGLVWDKFELVQMILLFNLGTLCLMFLSEQIADQVSSYSDQGGHDWINPEDRKDQIKGWALVSNIYDWFFVSELHTAHETVWCLLFNVFQFHC